jgi:hydrogenase expression/formation protein HypC
MCLAIPGKIIRIEGDFAEVNLAGTLRKASLQLVPEAQVGQYILLHAGFAIQVMDEDEAQESLKLLEEIGEVSG